MSKSMQFLTRTALMLALTIVFQSLRTFVPIPEPADQFVIGSLVNLCLMVAAVMIGLKGGLAVAILAPVIALLQGQIKFPAMVPFVALGNAVIVTVFAYYYPRNKTVALAAGAILKAAVLYVGIVQIALPFFLAPQLAAPAAEKMSILLSFKFGWPQAVTALLGGVMTMTVMPLLQKALKENMD